jgi:hypothetical protein
LPKPGTDAAAPAPRTEIGLHSTVAERIIGMLEQGADAPRAGATRWPGSRAQSGAGRLLRALLFVLTQLDFEDWPRARALGPHPAPVGDLEPPRAREGRPARGVCCSTSCAASASSTTRRSWRSSC